jgi:hypothetical protein
MRIASIDSTRRRPEITARNQIVEDLARSVEQSVGRLASAVDSVSHELAAASALLSTVSDKVDRRVEDVQGSVYDVQVALAELRASSTERSQAEDSGLYQNVIRRIREVVRTAVPPDATVIVVTRGDDTLLDLYGRGAWHFPQDDEGTYAGHYPEDGSPVISHLEDLREKGGDFLLFPKTAFWWLEHYPDLRAHLLAHYSIAVQDDSACVMFSLGSLPGESA